MGALIPVTREFVKDSLAMPFIKLVDNLIYSRKEPHHHILRPFLKSLCKYGMISICKSLGYDGKSIIPGIVMLVHKYAHKFRNYHSRMGIIDMYSHLICEIIKCWIVFHMVRNYILCRSRHKEILLLQTKLLALVVAVSRVENLGDELSLVVAKCSPGIITS